MLVKLACKNILARRSSFVIIAFIAFAVMLLSVTNAVFDSTEQGIEHTFIQSFTGDIVVRPKSRTPLSLFGDETPVTGAMTEIERLIPYTDIGEAVLAHANVAGFFPQISCNALMELRSARVPAALFGVDGAAYLAAMPAIRIVQGAPYTGEDKGIMLSETLAAQMGASVGDTIQFTVVDGITFRIRAVPLTAIYAYEVQNAILDKIALVNAGTVRELLGIGNTTSADVQLSEDQQELLNFDFDDDALFFSAEDISGQISAGEPLFSSEPDTDGTEAFSAEEQSTTWNFMVCSVKHTRQTAATIRTLNRQFKKKNWPVEAVNWRHAAGSTALYLYWMRLIFNVGILIILAAGFIVVNNTLVINVLDRLREIGTMRAIGAAKRYISLECMLETLLLTITAGILGCVLGFVASHVVTSLHITFTNAFLMQLFGSDALVTSITASNVRSCLMLSLLLGLLAWVYPVYTALQANPVQAMQGAK